MGDFKKKHGKSRFGKVLQSVTKNLPELAGDVFNVITSPNPGGAVLSTLKAKLKSSQTGEVGDKLLADIESIPESQLRVFEMEVDDRKDARGLYSKDPLIQKIFAIVFLIGYGSLAWYMLKILSGKAVESELFKTMVTMIFTHTSTKLSTIIDFLFGGSMKQN